MIEFSFTWFYIIMNLSAKSSPIFEKQTKLLIL